MDFFFLISRRPSQSKSLNSDSGVVFSPPSIVKDALSISQSAALLLDDEQNETITPENLENSASSQVHFNLIPFNDATSNAAKLNCNYSSSSSASVSASPSLLNYHHKMIPLQNHQKLYNQNVGTLSACKTLIRNQKHFVPLAHNNRLIIKCERDDENEPITYNPYANENDQNDTKFQLSKSIQYQNELNQTNHCPIEIPLVRRFGQDRTNFYNILPKVEPISKRQATTSTTTADCVAKGHAQSALPSINQQQFNCFSLRDRISISSHYTKNVAATTTSATFVSNNENSQSNDSQSTFAFNTNSNENLTFKNYDLNDEFWLNFDE